MFIETTRPDVKETVLVPSREWDEACESRVMKVLHNV